MPKKDTPADYQQLSQELAAIVAALQDNDLDVDTAVKSYERGLQLVRQLEAHITTAENTVTKLSLQNVPAVDGE